MNRRIVSQNLINPDNLKEYIIWWDKYVTHLFDKNQYSLVGIPFQTKNPNDLKIQIENQEIYAIISNKTEFWLLNELKQIEKRDIILFLNQHKIILPTDFRQSLVSEILDSSGGKYDLAIEKLKDFINNNCL